MRQIYYKLQFTVQYEDLQVKWKLKLEAAKLNIHLATETFKDLISNSK